MNSSVRAAVCALGGSSLIIVAGCASSSVTKQPAVESPKPAPTHVCPCRQQAPAAPPSESQSPHPAASNDGDTASSAPAVDDPTELELAPAEPDALPAGTTILHIGDSFAGALGISLNRELKQSHVRGVLHYKTSSFIPDWAFSRDVPLYIAQAKPDLVLITLGANEVAIKDPEQRGAQVRRLVRMLGDRPCVWIAPPLWKNAPAALLSVIRDNCSPCRYMDTNQLFPDMPRVRDGVHPSMPARDVWAKLVLHWLAAQRETAAQEPWALKPDETSAN